MKFDELDIGAHFRLPSRLRGATLPTVRVKVAPLYYTVLGRNFKHLAAAKMDVIPVSEHERQTGERT